MPDRTAEGTEVFFLRHAQTDWNVAKRLQGRTDRPLTATATDALLTQQLPASLLPVRVFASPLRRARETAKALGLDAQIAAPLSEMSWGEWEGRRLADLRATLGEQMLKNEDAGLDFRPDGGESPRDVVARALPWLASLAGTSGNVVAITHKGVIRALFAHAWGWDMRGRAPRKLDWQHLQSLIVAADGSVRSGRLNVPLEAR